MVGVRVSGPAHWLCRGDGGGGGGGGVCAPSYTSYTQTIIIHYALQ